jgi:hypothetical protein
VKLGKRKRSRRIKQNKYINAHRQYFPPLYYLRPLTNGAAAGYWLNNKSSECCMFVVVVVVVVVVVEEVEGRYIVGRCCLLPAIHDSSSWLVS